MKKIILFLLSAIVFMASASAQKVITRNGDERFGKKIITTDSTFRSIDSAFVNTNEAGILEAKVVAFDVTGNKGATAYLVVRYSVVAGTITVSDAEFVSPLTVDSGLSPANTRFTSSGGKIYLQVKGKLNQTVHWLTILKRTSVFK